MFPALQWSFIHPCSIEKVKNEPRELKTLKVPKDGHCLFYAWILSLEDEGFPELPTKSRLMAMVRDEILSHLEFYGAFNESSKDLVDDLDKYLSNNIYGSDIADMVINALCNCTHSQVVVYEEKSGKLLKVHREPLAPGRIGTGAAHTIKILKTNEHYDSLVSWNFIEPEYYGKGEESFIEFCWLY